MTPATISERERTAGTPDAAPSLFRLQAIMRQGTASSIPETWALYDSVESARAAVKQAYHDDRVLRMYVVSDDVPPRFVEWVER